MNSENNDLLINEDFLESSSDSEKPVQMEDFEDKSLMREMEMEDKSLMKEYDLICDDILNKDYLERNNNYEIIHTDFFSKLLFDVKNYDYKTFFINNRNEICFGFFFFLVVYNSYSINNINEKIKCIEYIFNS